MNTQIEALQADIAQCTREIADLTAEPGGSMLHYWTIAHLREQMTRDEARIAWLQYHDELQYAATAA